MRPTRQHPSSNKAVPRISVMTEDDVSASAALSISHPPPKVSIGVSRAISASVGSATTKNEPVSPSAVSRQ